ncbi:PRKR-interacting protein 1 homolog [Gymnodraco acuticeps]|uniref:PRKR-interacting protein 1 homolog n=1 Tax=Gymnodraco acuticeps TaxID=8218 RepID=A0A6P8VS88_GYMAC|nr:PRKR-interacting protein 1 homolog [Gymnodraco acuticeps]
MAANTQKNNKRRKPGGKESSQPLIIAKTQAEEQRLELEKLMRNPDRPDPIPDRPKEWNPRATPEFVRDVMGAGAGAGSGEFYVCRRLRRREYQGREFLDRMSGKVNEDIECLDEVELSKRAAGDGAAGRGRKRKRLRRKMRIAKIEKKEMRKKAKDARNTSSEKMEEASGDSAPAGQQ